MSGAFVLYNTNFTDIYIPKAGCEFICPNLQISY